MKEKYLKLQAGGVEYHLHRENFDALIWRDPTYSDLDHFIVHETENRIRVLGMPEFVRFAAGIAFKGSGAPYVPRTDKSSGTFEEAYGWFADSYIRTGKPTEDEIEAFARFEADRDINEDGSFDLPEED